MAGGGGARNWLPERSTNGLTSPHFQPSAIGDLLIGSCRHSPGSIAPRIFTIHAWIDLIAAILRPTRQDQCCGHFADRDASHLGARSHAAGSASDRARAAHRTVASARGTSPRACRALPGQLQLRQMHRRRYVASRCSSDTRRRSSSPHRRSRYARWPWRGSPARARAARRTCVTPRAALACDRDRWHPPRPDSSSAGYRRHSSDDATGAAARLGVSVVALKAGPRYSRALVGALWVCAPRDAIGVSAKQPAATATILLSMIPPVGNLHVLHGVAGGERRWRQSCCRLCGDLQHVLCQARCPFVRH